jgi:hypothetical protein
MQAAAAVINIEIQTQQRLVDLVLVVMVALSIQMVHLAQHQQVVPQTLVLVEVVVGFTHTKTPALVLVALEW